MTNVDLALRPQPLAGVSVVEIAEGVGGPYCGRLLSDLGADVLKLEPPEGDAARRLGPFPASSMDGEPGGLFTYLNSGKRIRRFDLHAQVERAGLEQCLTNADLLIESLTEAERATCHLLPDELCRDHPRLIVASVTPFGRSGRYRDWLRSEIVDWAMGGYMYFTGDPEREPLMAPGQQAGYHAGIQAAIAALAALHERERSGRGQTIDLSMQEAALSAHCWLSVMWSHEGKIQGREPPDLVRCADGWVHFFSPALYDDLFLLIGRPDLLEKRPPLTSLEQRMAFSAQLMPHLAEWAKTRHKAEIYEAAQELRIAVAPVSSVPDLLVQPQLLERGFFRRVDHTSGVSLTLPGMPYRLSERTGALDKDSSGADLSPFWMAGSIEAAGNAGKESSGPLEGLRVLEVTANWAGPLAARHLADLGAEVIKVEWPRRPATRAAHYAGGQLWTRPYNRAGYFNNLNRNKISLTLDLSHPAGREQFLRLVRRADVLIENNSARVMGNLGLDYDTLAAENARLVMLSISGYGATGPQRDHLAYGSNIEAACGLSSVMGYSPDEPRRTSSFYADPVAAGHGAIAVLAALRQVRRTGRGMHIDVSLNESAICLLGDAFAEYGLTGLTPLPRGNRSREIAPQGCYPCVGTDCWLALAVPDNDTWHALCRLLEREDWLQRAELLDVEGRKQAHDELDTGIEAWAREHDHYEAARLLQAAGVPAAPVLINWELLSDPHLHDRGFYVPIEHPETGVLPYPGLPWQFSRTPATIRVPAPRFGEHNRQVLAGILGLGDADIEALRREGTIADAPVIAPPTPPQRQTADSKPRR